jgi:hypothetical protein
MKKTYFSYNPSPIGETKALNQLKKRQASEIAGAKVRERHIQRNNPNYGPERIGNILSRGLIGGGSGR